MPARLPATPVAQPTLDQQGCEQDGCPYEDGHAKGVGDQCRFFPAVSGLALPRGAEVTRGMINMLLVGVIIPTGSWTRNCDELRYRACLGRG